MSVCFVAPRSQAYGHARSSRLAPVSKFKPPALTLFTQASVAAAARRHWHKPVADKYIVPVSSGIIAGESLMGVTIALTDARDLVTEVISRERVVIGR